MPEVGAVAPTSGIRVEYVGSTVSGAASNSGDDAAERTLRSDALASRERILDAAQALAGHRRTSMSELAAAAGVSRSTLYRHFATLADVRSALAQRPHRAATEPPSTTVSPLGFQPPGRLGRGAPLPLEVTHVLDEVPPHLVPDQLVAEARRAGGVPVALYVVDIDGSQLIRLAGSEDFPAELEAPPALGPEIVPEGVPAYQERLRRLLPGCVAQPLWLRGRVLGLLICIGTPITPLDDIATQGAAALELANDYTDAIEAVRRSKPTTAAAEVQQNLFPPRIARIAGAQLAGGLLPAYEVGGDWFDFVENRDGAWLAIADASGKGPTAAGLGASALGALRSARRSGATLEQAVAAVHETVLSLGNSEFHVTAIIGRWYAATSTFTWINCGHPDALVAHVDGRLEPFGGPSHEPLGAGDRERTFTPSSRQLQSEQRLIFVTDGVTERRVEGGGTFGVDGIRDAIAELEPPTAAATAMAILQRVSDCWREPLEDDGTVVVLSVA